MKEGIAALVLVRITTVISKCCGSIIALCSELCNDLCIHDIIDITSAFPRLVISNW